MFIAKVEWVDEELSSEFDTLLIPAKDWAEAIEQIKEYFPDDILTVIHYLERWEDILIVDDDLICDINTIRNIKRE